MNFLGHLFLSGNDPLVTVGNFMADAVKGRDLSRFPEGVQRGIRLHRAIDAFTDAHPLHRAGRARVRPHAGRYAAVVVDLFYDHLLAAGWHIWHPEPLVDYAARMYRMLHAHEHLLPARTRGMLPYMIAGDWLSSYAELDGLARALDGLSRRTPEGAPMRGAEHVLHRERERYTEEFTNFLPEVAYHVKEQR
jgi:acyl carrier protein phosphodiesterase